MPTVTLDEMDLRAFVTAFNSIAEVADYSFDGETEYRLAIANLVGELKEQLAPGGPGLLRVTPRVELATVLADTYRAWNDRCAAGVPCQTAAALVGEYLDRAGGDGRQFTGGDDATAAVAQLCALPAVAGAWERYELALCSMPRREIEALQLPDLLGNLVVAEQGSGAGGSFWGRWKKP
jgi:hypothetical protein